VKVYKGQRPFRHRMAGAAWSFASPLTKTTRSCCGMVGCRGTTCRSALSNSRLRCLAGTHTGLQAASRLWRIRRTNSLSTAQFATVLDQVAAILVGVAFLNLHRHPTYNAGEEIDQRAPIVVGEAHCMALSSIGQMDSITRFIAGCLRPGWRYLGPQALIAGMCMTDKPPAKRKKARYPMLMTRNHPARRLAPRLPNYAFL